MKSSEVFYQAADDIAAFGHHKGEGYGDGPWSTAPACSIGAINRVVIRESGLINGAQVHHATFRQYLNNPLGVVGWNDAPDRTAEEVVEAFRACAVIEAAREQQDAAWATYAEQVSV